MSQIEVESRYHAWRAEVDAGRADADVVPGAPEDWQTTVHPHVLMLLAPVGHWHVYDAAHDEWRDTGVGPGDVQFEAVGTRLLARR